MTAEMALQNTPVFCAIEYGAPGFELSYAIRRFFRVQLRHSPLIHVLPAAHGVGTMHFPVVAFVHVCECRSDSNFRHYGVRFAEQGLANKSDAHSTSGS